MKFDNELSRNTGQRGLILLSPTDPEVYLEWNIVSFAKPKNLNLITIEINDYWAQLPKDKVEAIWAKYVELHEMLDTIADVGRLHQQVQKACAELLDLHPYEDILHYVRHRSNVKYPLDLRTEYSADAPEGPLTYLRGEYTELLALILQLRVMVPIWGAYMARVKEAVGMVFKEYQAAHLLSRSHVVVSKPYRRLFDYINAYVESTNLPLSAMLSGLGSAELPDWLLAIALVRRLSVCELTVRGEGGDATNAVSNVYNYIKSKLESAEKTFSTNGMVRNKIPEHSRNASDEDNTSVPELYKIKEPVSEGTLETYSVFSSDVLWVARNLDSTIPESTVTSCITRLRNSSTYDIDDVHIVLTQWIMNSIIPSRAIKHLDHTAVINVIAATQALLFHWGFVDLGVILTAEPKNLPSDSLVGVTRTRLTKEEMETLAEIYPYYQVLKGKRGQRIYPSDPNATKQELLKQNIQFNPVINSIELLSDKMSTPAWVAQRGIEKEFPSGLLSMEKSEYGYFAPSDIRNQLAKLLIHLFTVKQQNNRGRKV